MQFKRIEPPPNLCNLVECYWTVMSESKTPVLQKIIPDGFPEIIFHFGDSYRIKLAGRWELQGDSLLAGQITKYFFLENSGISDILGIKLKPTALTQIFGIIMSPLKNKVVALSDLGNKKLNSINHLVRECDNHLARINTINEQLTELSRSTLPSLTIEKAIDSIFSSHGMVSIASICELCDVSERQLERLFNKYIGLPPKFYSRIIRFSYIFQIAQDKKLSWSDLGMESGFYDQPHFIKNFKTFTGEDPSKYFFDEPNLSNFFLKKV